MARPLKIKYNDADIMRAAMRLKVKQTNNIIHGIIGQSGLYHDEVMYKIKCKVFSTHFVDSFNERNNPEITDWNNHEKYERKTIFNHLSIDGLVHYNEEAQYIIHLYRQGHPIMEIINELSEPKDVNFNVNNTDIKPLADQLKRKLDKQGITVDQFIEQEEEARRERDEIMKNAEIEFHNAHWYEYSDEDREQLIEAGVLSPIPPDDTDQFGV